MTTAKNSRKGAARTETKQISVSEARINLSEIVELAKHGAGRFKIMRYGKAIAAIVSAEDLARLDGAA